MSVKDVLKRTTLPLIAGGLVSVAWLLSCFIPAQARMTRWERAVAELSPSAPLAEVCAAARSTCGVQLLAEDVATWRVLQMQGVAPAEAMRIVVLYRQAQL